MTLAVSVHAEEAAELEAAAIWYDDQRDGLGLQFLAAEPGSQTREPSGQHTALQGVRPGQQVDLAEVQGLRPGPIGSVKAPKQVEVWADRPGSKVDKVLKTESKRADRQPTRLTGKGATISRLPTSHPGTDPCAPACGRRGGQR